MNPKNWPLNTYTDATWTDLVAEAAIVSTILISSSAVTDVTIEIRLEDAGSGLATIVQPTVISPGGSASVDVRSIAVTGTQAIQVRCDVAGAEFLASGAV